MCCYPLLQYAAGEEEKGEQFSNCSPFSLVKIEKLR
jgi:hypothetical protein